MFRSEALTESHYLENFTCGNADLDAWLKKAALNAGRSGTARTYLWLLDSDEVAAYFSVTPTAVDRVSLPKSLSGGSPHWVPGYLLAKLARHERFRGERIGDALLADALEVIVDAAVWVGGRVVVVDAIDDDAIRFYERNGFIRLAPDSDRLALKMREAAEAIGLPWPP